MTLALCLLLCLVVLVQGLLKPMRFPDEYYAILESQIKSVLEDENKVAPLNQNTCNLAAYMYNINVTEQSRLAMIKTLVYDGYFKQKKVELLLKNYNYERLNGVTGQRYLQRLLDLGSSVLPLYDYELLQTVISNMQTNYANATVCAYMNPEACGLSLEPHIQERLANSRDPKELTYYWQQWHDKAGTPMKANFAEYVELTGRAARMNKYPSYAEYWLQFYDDRILETNFDAIFGAILPLYKEIHGYVRYRLRQHYGDAVVPEYGNIPMHLLGNMWAQTWDEKIDLYTPFPEKPFFNITAEMQRQQYSVEKMFKLGNAFFKSLGMHPLPQSFWNLSVLERPADRQIICDASAWDLYQDSDVRIKMCAEVNAYYLYVVHRELGHIQYYLQYEHQQKVYRAAPNPGFPEAVGDVIALSFFSPRHLKSIGLSPVEQLDEQSRINDLFKMALKKVVFLPYAYIMDKYRYALFRGEVEESKWNCAFWQMRSDYSGIEPPIVRTDADFDPPAKYHFDADMEYMRYFAAHIFQFQFHKALCKLAGQYKPNDPLLTLDNCDIYNSKEAGKALSKLLSLGAAKHWKDALEEFTGQRIMDPSALLNYFKPLRQWLRQEIKRLNVPLGWEMTDKIAPDCRTLKCI